MPDARRVRVGAAARWLLPATLLGAWLLFLTSRQVALFPRLGPPLDSSPLVSILIAATVIVLVVRLWRPTTATHVAMLALVTGSIALLAAQPGNPLANATVDYCGDFCRAAIMGRMATFFGWPIVTAGALWVLARYEAGIQTNGHLERAAWTRAWAVTSLILGLAASVTWWRIILPNG